MKYFKALTWQLSGETGEKETSVRAASNQDSNSVLSEYKFQSVVITPICFAPLYIITQHIKD
jgi:hypothetical protein